MKDLVSDAVNEEKKRRKKEKKREKKARRENTAYVKALEKLAEAAEQMVSLSPTRPLAKRISGVEDALKKVRSFGLGLPASKT